MPIAIKNSKIDISSEKTTKVLAESFKNFLQGGEIIFLYGEMGVGKTTFIKYLINEFQKSSDFPITEVSSPTFNLLNEYQIGPKKIKHYDLFRIKNKRDTNDLNIFEKDNNLITFVEWPELVKDIQEKVIVLRFNYENELNNRSVEITGID
ncbi:tRNA (adenosine(37)-N6)-threonylcarbamoyltransferase complex ATPase subunit type 1 TsaE [Candidatus Pelagibacter sp. HIMB1485]|uniref:tRNA (adenosine(37)-N6)-threonylcarbamoyltransferase complex ATPase subunit type 1 TsaE n=1 Tax=Candidatus Pelagibacter sp. HIMB1485 TaxID=3415415 RepID=UPI003F862B8A